MSRKIAYAYLGLLTLTGAAAATDKGCPQPGEKHGQQPRIPYTSGILGETCFGYYQTRWTVACTSGGPCGGLCVPAPAAIIVAEPGPAAGSGRVQTAPPPAQMPAPAPKK